MSLLPLIGLLSACHPQSAPETCPHHSPSSPQAKKAFEVSEAGFRLWLEQHVAALRPLDRAQTEASWKATASGKKEDYDASAEAALAYERFYSSNEDFTYLKAVREANVVKDPVEQRELEVIYLKYLGNQFDPALMEEIIRRSSALEEKFNTFRVKLGDKVLTDNDVEGILRGSLNEAERRAVWEGSKSLGSLIGPELLELVRLRNQAARQLGYENFYVLSLALGDQNENELFALLDSMAEATEKPFLAVKATLDASLAQRYGIPVSALMPWHYEDRFFQEAPAVGAVDLDPYYKGKDPIGMAKAFYASIGLPVDNVLEHSDLYEREGKYQHAYCTDIDREGDVRIMESVRDSVYWMDTTLHELGHSVYSLGTDANPALPYVLRDAAHTFTTEGVANLMGRLAYSAPWLQAYAGVSVREGARLDPMLRDRSRMAALVFSRWCQVMAHFERDLYRNPDQDLNALWWQYVKKYQALTPPPGRNAPDYAAKIHLVSSPVYYHNYLLGDLYASQLHQALVDALYPGQDPWKVIYSGNPAVGKYLNERVFTPGLLLPWPKFVEASTGAPLSAAAFAKAYMPEAKK